MRLCLQTISRKRPVLFQKAVSNVFRNVGFDSVETQKETVFISNESAAFFFFFHKTRMPEPKMTSQNAC